MVDRPDRHRLDLPDAEVWLWPAFLPGEEAERLLQALLREVPWQQRSIRMFGRDVPQPRLVSWHGDPGCAYTYSGLRLEPRPWTPALTLLRDRLAERTGAGFNSVLANLYRDGNDSMGWHADDEPELGPEPRLASVSLGAERRFDLRHRTRKDLPVASIPLAAGSLLEMAGSTQRHWKHRIARTRRACGPRANLTFRQILDRSSS